MKTNTKKHINIITLGCSKNLVDSEVLMKQIKANNITVEHDVDNSKANIVIINTCGFIGDAKQESIELILQYVDAKKEGLIEELYIMGCLSERYKEDLKKEIPEVDNYFGVDDLSDILESLKIDYKTELLGERETTTPKHYAYLKISEGCDRSCAFCAIPLIRGKHISKSIEDLVGETKSLVAKGVKEIILIAQDLSYYGYDLYKESRLAELLEKLSDIKGVEWIRLHYAYPANFPMEVIKLMSERDNICKYLDIPVQHISDNVLKLMRRGHDEQKTRDLIKDFKNEMPEMAIRTTMLVGHPGETEEDFNNLVEFVKETKFDRLGVFTYSNEEDTNAYINYKDEIPEEVKVERQNILMDIQQKISNELNVKRIGNNYKVLIDREEGGFYIGRTEFDSPEVDNEVLISSEGVDIKIGEFYNVKINSSDDFDLYGEIL